MVWRNAYIQKYGERAAEEREAEEREEVQNAIHMYNMCTKQPLWFNVDLE
jgi:hypothetical protein